MESLKERLSVKGAKCNYSSALVSENSTSEKLDSPTKKLRYFECDHVAGAS